MLMQQVLPLFSSLFSNKTFLLSWQFYLSIILFSLIGGNSVYGANPDGDLEIQLLSSSNLIVAPNGTGPQLVYIGAKIINKGQNDLTDISISIGDFNKNTPGVYPEREHAGLSGKLALKHQASGGNYSDANRFLKSLAAGESVVQYWLIEYPKTDQNGTSVSLTDINEDDLWLQYDVWATASDAGVKLAANTSQTLYFRSQSINTNSQAWGMDSNELPSDYQDLLGSMNVWDENTQVTGVAGQSIVVPVWHQLGKVRNGFDSNADLLPDYNAFLQPVGSLTHFDPSCFRLIRTYGVLLVKDQDGNITYSSFNNQSHFTNISQENAKVMALVNYEMMVIGSECQASLSPFQSVASHIKQESYNQNFGTPVGTLTALKHPFALNSTLDENVDKGAKLNVNYHISSSHADALGKPALASGLSLYTKIPTGTALVGGSVSSELTALYSINDGLTWQNTEPSDASTVTDILWLFEEAITDQKNTSSSFQIHIPADYSSSQVEAIASLQLQGGKVLQSNKQIVPVSGDRVLNGKIFSDTGSPQHFANGQLDNGESSIAGVHLALYIDANANGLLDEMDSKIRTQITDAHGKYDFRSLANGNYILLIDADSNLMRKGWFGTTTSLVSPVSLINNNVTNHKLGMSPMLKYEQSLLNPNPAHEGELLKYKISLQHLMDQSDVSLVGAIWSQDYNPAQLEFVSANPQPTSIDPVSGKLDWMTAGMIMPGQTQEIELVFRSIATNYTQAYDVQLISSVNDLKFSDHRQIESLKDTLIQPILPSGSISGYIWNDLTGTTAGWTGVQGFDADDNFLPEIELFVFACLNSSGERLTPSTANLSRSCESGPNGGNWVLLDSTISRQDGSYAFQGLGEGYYYVAVNPASLPTNNTLKGDPDESGLCTDCDGMWGDPSQALQTLPLVNASTDYDNTNFGYAVSGGLSGYIWNDINGNGIKESTELGIANYPVELLSGNCSAGTDCPSTYTDATGYYRFENLTDNQSYTVSLGANPSSNLFGFDQTAEADGQKDGIIVKTITNAQWHTDLNFGYRLNGPATLSVKLISDWNANLMKDNADEGINGVAVNLYFDANEDGEFDATIDPFVKSLLTDANGEAIFKNLIHGTYFHQLQIQDHSVLAQTQMIADPDESNGPCSSCDAIAKATLSHNQQSQIQTWTFQPIGNKQIEGLVWRDNNADKLAQTSIEAPIANISVSLNVDLNQDGVYVPLTTEASAADGTFRFAELIQGTYQIRVNEQDTDLPTNDKGVPFVATNPIEAILALDDNAMSFNTLNDAFLGFGFSQMASIGNIVFWDHNKNGQRDELEAGIGGVQVCLCEGETSNCTPTNALLSVYTSDGTDGTEVGSYLFENLTSGNYTISVQSQTAPINNATQTAHPAAFGEPCTAGCNSQYSLKVESGRKIEGIDFGYASKGVVGGVVWLDLNNNKVMDEGEEGLANQTIALIPPSRVNIGAGRGRALIKSTNQNGEYIYDNLPDGSYRLSAKAPAGYVLTNDGDGDVNGLAYIFIRGGAVIAYGRTYCSDCNMDANVGLRTGGYYEISGNICIDDPNLDGLCNNASLDVQLGGMNVLLTQQDGTYLGSVLTQDDGSYSFPNLNPGTYNVSLPLVGFPLDIANMSTNLGNSNASQISNDSLQSTLQVVINNSNLNDIDFAYELNVDFDLGSLPYDYYQRTGFAYHIIDSNNPLYLGQEVESQALTYSSASGFIADNPSVSNGSDDGISFLDLSAWEVGTVAENKGGSLQAEASDEGWLVGWIDFNQDQDFLDPGEMIINEGVTTGVQTFNFAIPAGTSLDQTYYSRFRLFDAEPDIPPVAFSGGATAGEIEDYGIDFSSLPVELLSFEATLTELGVDLEWVTASEQNTKEFLIERSIDGLLFSTVGSQEAVGTSSELQIYEWEDERVINGGFPELFYRLKMIDNDGSFAYSTIRSVVISDNSTLSLIIAPSPPIEFLKADFTADPNKTTTLSIINGVGQTMWSETVQPQSGLNKWQHNISDYPSGFYFLRLASDKEFRVVKFLKN